MHFQSISSLTEFLQGVVTIEGERIKVLDESGLPEKIDQVVETAVFAEGLVREVARWIIWEASQQIGIYPASIHELYMAIGRGEVPHNFTVPAMNVRAMNFNTSRAIFRAAKKHHAGAMLFEIARSEIGYTRQRPAEYSSCVLAAAIKEGFRGPVYIQGDHFQISAGRFKQDSEAEVTAVKELMAEAVDAGFYNIDIDTSTLVDLSYPTLDEQQRANYELCASLTKHARALQPEGITISLGGEIGEVGHKNSTVEELHAFMKGYNRQLDAATGISKISVQTGTSHGGVVLPDGSLADVKVDFDTLEQLSRAARDSYGLGGAVQHGASTLPPSAFGKFPEVGTVEIHLATNFQNMIYDRLPAEIVETAYQYVRDHFQEQWKEGKTEEQFLYSNRKRAIGAFKADWWSLPADKKAAIGAALQEEFEFLFEKLNIGGTLPIARALTPYVAVHKPRPLETVAETGEEDVSDLAD